MTTYAKITDFASKDALLTGNPAKIVKGVEIDDEFNAIATADATSVKGPIGVTVDNTVVRWDGTTGRAVQGSGVTISDADVVTASGFTGPVGATTPNTGAFTTLSATDYGTFKGLRIGQDGANDIYAATGSINYSVTSGQTHLFRVNSALVGNFSSTGLAVTGALSATGGITNTSTAATNTIAFNSTSTTTGYNLLNTNNSAGQASFGIDTSTGTLTGTANAGVIYTNASPIVLYAAGGKATLDTAGNLGLGVAPDAWNASYKSFTQQGGGAISGTTGLTQYSSNMFYNGSSQYIYRTSDFATMYRQTSGAHTWYTAPSGTAGNAITFTQAMTLDASGNQLLGTTAAVYSAGERLTISAASTKNGIGISVSGGGKGIGIYNAQSSGATSGTMLEFQNSSSVVVGSVQATGTTTTYNTTSDHRLKENVRPANAGRFMDIEFVDFEWTDGRHDCGVIAHQLQSVYPDLVIGEKDATEVRTVEITPAVPEVKDEDGNVITEAVPAVTEEQTFPVYQQVNYTGLIGRMGTRIQQLQRTVDLMEARLAALEAA